MDEQAMTGKQKDIVLAACRLFEEYGFTGTGMEQIAEAANVSKRTLYKHHASKEAVFSAIIAYLRDGAKSLKWPEYDPHTDVRSQVQELVRSMLVRLSSEEHTRLSRIVISEAVRRPELGRAVSQTVDVADSGPFFWIKAAIADGALRPDAPEKVLSYLAGLAKNAALWPQLLFCSAPLDDQELSSAARECTDFFLAYYGME